MKNLAFVIWMICFPISINIGEAIDKLVKLKCNIPIKIHTESVEHSAGLIVIIVWIVIGVILYEK